MRPARTGTLLLTTLCVLSLAGCGEEEQDVADIDLSGVEITVGSKNFTEQYVLSEILVQALAAHGADVTDATDTGDTPTTRAALEDGEIDAYWAYNSTAYVELLDLGAPPPEEGEDITEEVRAVDEDNGLVWIDRSTFNNTYGFAMTPELAEENQATRYSVDAFNLTAMAEYLEENPDTTVCVEQEFPDRDDGLALFEEATDYEIPDEQLQVLDDQAAVYEGFADGVCDFGEVFTTDGQIDELDLELVVDPGVFYVYNVSLVMREDVYEQAPEDIEALVGEILAPMSQSRITELNRRVDGGEPVAEVAEDFLERFGLD